jgi:hypothetical protein
MNLLDTGTAYISSHPVSVPGVEWWVDVDVDDDDSSTDDNEDSTLNSSNNSSNNSSSNTLSMILFVSILSSVLTFLILYHVDPSFSCLKGIGKSYKFKCRLYSYLMLLFLVY